MPYVARKGYPINLVMKLQIYSADFFGDVTQWRAIGCTPIGPW